MGLSQKIQVPDRIEEVLMAKELSQGVESPIYKDCTKMCDHLNKVKVLGEDLVAMKSW